VTGQLSAEDFPGFFRQAYGEDPFPWQQELVDWVLEERRWPDVIDVPTGLGKTSLIDAAVFVAAVSPEAGRRRVFFVVDRRLVVDEAYEHALRLRDALGSAGGICGEVARRLRQRGDGPGAAVPEVTRMRGGVTWSWRWLERPDRHAVITGTVDQIGSRLLFRGYGVGEYLRPIDAALTGTDSLVIIDEAHLSDSFVRTIRHAASGEPGGPWRPPVIITMSATATPHPGARVHRISRADEQDDRAGRRLSAPRRLRLLAAPPGGKKDDGVVDSVLAGWAQALARGPDSGRVIAVVCNTVSRARAVFDRLTCGPVDTVLLTGRIREIDRAYLARQGWYERARAGRNRAPGRPLILVATQTIEVGANIDADALVAESASLDALTQRLGRLNRLGDLGDAIALVVHDPAASVEDPVYGPARLATWQWLSGLAEPLQPKRGTAPDLSALQTGLDVSPMALRHLTRTLDADSATAMRSPLPYVPVLSAAILEAWARTSPAPHPDPPVAPFLHGIGHGEPDVAIIWRSGLTGDPEAWPPMIAAVPPSAEEAIEVPLRMARRWMRGEYTAAAAVGDLDGAAADAADPASGNGSDDSAVVRQVLRYKNQEDIQLIPPHHVRAGDTIIVPAQAGGCDQYGWNPASTRPVTDVADLAYRRGRPLLRLAQSLDDVVGAYHHQDAYHSTLSDAVAALVAQARDDVAGDGPDTRGYQRALAEILRILQPEDSEHAEAPLLRNLRILAASCTASPYPPAIGRPGEPAAPALDVLLAARGGGHAGDPGALGSSALGQREPASLGSHQRAVARRAQEFASNLGLDPRLTASIRMAAELHDEGKKDPRFQAMLRGRTPSTLGATLPPLAKSGMDPADRAAFRRVQRLAGYPYGMRHEALSAQIASLRADGCGHGVDVDLVVHLVAAHHGRSRPLLPAVTDPDPHLVPVTISDSTRQLSTAATVDWDAPRRFAELNRRYGRWGLALLETILRLADIWCSERDERADEVDY